MNINPALVNNGAQINLTTGMYQPSTPLNYNPAGMMLTNNNGMPSAPGGSRTDTVQNPPPTTGPGGSPQTGTSYVPPNTPNFATGSDYVSGVYNGQKTPTSNPTLDSYLRSQLNSYFSPSSVEQGTAQRDIAPLLTSSAAAYLAANPSAGNANDINSLVQQYAGQYSQWLSQYQSYLGTQGGNISLPGQVKTPITDLNQLIYSPTALSGPASTPGHTPPPTTPPGFTPVTDTSGGAGVGLTNPQMMNTSSPPASMLTGSMQPPYTAPPAPGLTADQMLAYNSGDTNYLRSIVESGGAPINATPAWQAAVEAMKHQNNVGLANLKEQFGASGNRFSTAFGGAAADYMNQATLNNNALLGQMMTTSQENAANRMTTGAGQLASQAHSALSQLSTQDFQAAMQATGNNLQAALAMLNAGYGAASQLNQGAIQGATALHNTENNAVSLGASMSNQAFQSYLANLGLGSQLGGQQSTLDQNTLSALYQEFLRTQPQYNPLINQFSQGANTYPNMFTPQFQASQLGQILGGLGGLIGASPEIISAITTLYNAQKNKNSGSNGTGGLPNINVFGSDIGGFSFA